MSGSCPACQAPAGAGDRFCRSCGAAIGLDVGPGATRGAGPGDGPAIDAPPAETTAGSVRRDAPTRWWLVALAVVAVVAAGWATTRAGGEGRAGAGRADRAETDDAGTSVPATGSTGAEPPTAEPTTGSGSGSPVEGSPVEGSTVDGGAPPGVRVVDEGSGPVLGRPVGWSLLMGDPHNAGGGIWHIDLDTGRVVRYLEVGGEPVVTLGDRVVMASTSSSGVTTLESISLTDPTGEPVPFRTPGEVAAVSLVPAPGPSDPGAAPGLWVYDDGLEREPRWLKIDVDRGVVMDEVPYAGGIVPGRGPELATSAAWGLYRRTGDGFRLLAPGRPIAAAGTDVLLEGCSSPTDCRMGWVNGDDGEPVDRPAPASDTALWWDGLVPGSERFLNGHRMAREQPFQLEAVVFDLVTGQEVEPEGVGRGVASSPDGRYLLTGDTFSSDPQGLVVHDTETGTSHPLDQPGQMGEARALFVANG